MTENLTPDKKLEILYGTVRRFSMPADDHDRLKQYAQDIFVALMPKPAENTPERPPSAISS